MKDIKEIECPFCKETVKEGAIKCKHCGEILNFDEKFNMDEGKYFSMSETILTIIGFGVGGVLLSLWLLWIIFDEPIWTPWYYDGASGGGVYETKDFTSLGWIIYLLIDTVIFYLLYKWFISRLEKRKKWNNKHKKQ